MKEQSDQTSVEVHSVLTSESIDDNNVSHNSDQGDISTIESSNESFPASPRAMVAAAVAEAKAQMKQSDEREVSNNNFETIDNDIANEVTSSSETKESVREFENNVNEMEELHLASKNRQLELEHHKMDLLKESIAGYWGDAFSIIVNKITSGKINDINVDKTVEKTTEVIYSQLEELSELGQETFQLLDKKDHDYFLLKQSHDAKEREVDSLTKGDEANRESLANLLRAIETSKGDVRDFSRTTQTESRLRNEISDLQEQNDKLKIAESDAKRKINLLDEELRLIKGKLNRVTQEKIKLERDARATISLARSLDNHATSDNEFYRRKLAELNDRLQAKNALVAEQQHQLEDMRRQMERSLSQSRLAQLRAEGGSLSNKRVRT